MAASYHLCLHQEWVLAKHQRANWASPRSSVIGPGWPLRCASRRHGETRLSHQNCRSTQGSGAGQLDALKHCSAQLATLIVVKKYYGALARTNRFSFFQFMPSLVRNLPKKFKWFPLQWMCHFTNFKVRWPKIFLSQFFKHLERKFSQKYPQFLSFRYYETP